MKILPQGVSDQKLQLLNKPGAPKPGQQTDLAAGATRGCGAHRSEVRGAPRVWNGLQTVSMYSLWNCCRNCREHAARVTLRRCAGSEGRGPGRTCFTVLSDGSMSPSVTTTSLILVLVM